MEPTFKATKVFKRNYDEYAKSTRLVVNQGGSRSSKTYSIAQLFILILLNEDNVLLTVCRKTFPALRSTAMRDFFDIMKSCNIYRVENHNKSDHTYFYNNNEIEFISVDEPQKIRGRKRKYLWMNEANEFGYEDFQQLNLRTEKQIFMDYNPSYEFHWIYDKILTRADCTFIQSTYKDNPFLGKETIAEIERLRDTDANYWRIYGLGERGISETSIYNHWQLADPPDSYDEVIYGLDFGFNNPTALIRIYIKDKNYWWQEVIYQSHLTNSELINKMNALEIPKNDYIFADNAEPQRIEEIKLAGYNIYPSDKDVRKGIDTLRTNSIFVLKDSPNILKEIKSYKWKTKDERATDDPVKENDHLMDAARYAVHTRLTVAEPDITFLT